MNVLEIKKCLSANLGISVPPQLFMPHGREALGMFSEVPEIKEALVMTCGIVDLSSIFYQANLWTPFCVNSGREVASACDLR